MKSLRFLIAGAAGGLSLFFATAPASAQTLHLNNRWDECSFLLDPSLTQASWRQFVKEAGLVTYFRPMASAEPMGRGSFEVALLQWGTRIDDADDTWNDTFSHPDPDHYLFEGDALKIPGVMLRAGVSERVDVGAYVTKAPGANYGFFGAQAQYAFLHDVDKGLAAAGRLGFVRMYGPEDLTFSTYGADLLVSKRVSRFTPYAGVSTYLSRGHETTTKVDLDDETVVGLRGTVGTTVQVWAVNLGAELNIAEVPGYSFKVAFAP